MKKLWQFRWVALILLLASGWVIWPLMRNGFYTSDDGIWMVIRLSAFYQSWADGQFPVRFLGRLFYGYGYPVPNFLYPGFLYLGSVLHVLGFSFVDSVKLILGGAVVGGGIASYLWIRRFFSQGVSLVGCILWLWCPYLLFDLYVRGSVGEVLGLSALMWSIYFLEAKYWRRFTLAVFTLILGHNILAAIGSGIILVYILARRRQAWGWWILSLGLGSFFWLPAVVERKYVQFNSVTISNPAQFVWEKQNQLLLMVIYLLGAAYLLFKKRKRDFFSVFSTVSVIGASFLTSGISLFLWSDKFTQIVQFPYRLFSVVVILGPWCVAKVLSDVEGRQKKIVISLFLMMLFGWQVGRVTRKVDLVSEPEGYYSTNEASTTVADEYLPRSVKEKPSRRAQKTVEVYKGKAEITTQRNISHEIAFKADVKETAELQINKFFYPGWGALVNDQPREIKYDNPQGLMRVRLTEGVSKVRVIFRETVLRFLTDLFSVASGLIFIASLIPLISKKR